MESLAPADDSLERLGASDAFRSELERLAQVTIADELKVEYDGLTFGQWVESLRERSA
jgi:hypothetical protein